MRSIAAVTMVYNESAKLPIWLRYYGAQLGHRHLYVIDNASDDGSTRHLGEASRLFLPNSAFDDAQRGRFVSQLHASLLGYYDCVIYTDCDEILVPDPAKYSGLRDYVERMSASHVTPVGLNVVQHLEAEPAALDPERPVLGQRSYCAFAWALCKTLIATSAIRWGPGFHESSLPPRFDPDLYLFHLRLMDLGTALRRQVATRTVRWANQDFGKLQRRGNDAILEEFRRYAQFARVDDPDAFRFDSEIEALLAGVQQHPQTKRYRFGRKVGSARLLRIPPRFAGTV